MRTVLDWNFEAELTPLFLDANLPYVSNNVLEVARTLQDESTPVVAAIIGELYAERLPKLEVRIIAQELS